MTTAAPRETTGQANRLQRPYIFLAEDDIDDQELLIEAIADTRPLFQVRTVSNGKKAALFLQALQDPELPALIILDFNLPEVDGGQLLQILSLKEQFGAIPIIVWSTSNSPVFKEICMSLGARAYFVKPHDLNGFRRLAEEMLAFMD